MKQKKINNADETLKIIKKVLDYNKNAQKNFPLASKIDKGNSEPKTEECIEDRTKLRRERIAEIKREEENINNLAFQYYFSKYQNPNDMYKNLRETKGKRKEDQVYLIKEILDEIKKYNKSAKEYVIQRNEKIINIVELILYFNQLEQQKGEGLKILTPNQMLSRFTIYIYKYQ